MTGQRPDEPLDDLLHHGPRDLDHDLGLVADGAGAAGPERGRGRWLLVAGFLIATAVAIALLLTRTDWAPFQPWEDVEPTAVTGPALLRDTPLRSAPANNAEVLIRLVAGTKLRPVGKSDDGRWLAAAADDRPDLVGWLPIEAVVGLDIASLTTVTADRTATAPRPRPAGQSAAPDLIVEAAYSRGNRLYISVLNGGPADARGTILASIDGAPPAPLEGKTDEGLRAGQRVQAAVSNAYVQIRGTVTVTISLSPAVTEADAANNTYTGIVEPDQPTDLELASVERSETDLVVTVRNLSTIPITGSYTITVREPSPGTRLLGRLMQTGSIEPGATTAFRFPELRDVDLSAISVSLSTDAIQDAVLGNNTYPR